jgi:hypothetical protein
MQRVNDNRYYSFNHRSHDLKQRAKGKFLTRTGCCFNKEILIKSRRSTN